MYNLKLKPAFKTAWIANLMSGIYHQGSAALKTMRWAGGEPFGYCCLGVAACTIQREFGIEMYEAGIAISERDNDLTIYAPSASPYGVSATLPREMMPLMFEDVDIKNSAQVMELDAIHAHLTSMNDKDRASFTEIATWIEQNL